jgi:hypothetical protein
MLQVLKSTAPRGAKGSERQAALVQVLLSLPPLPPLPVLPWAP